MRSLWGKAPADGHPLRSVPLRHGRARCPFQTIPAQPWRLDRVPQGRASVSPDAPRRGLVCRWRLPCGRFVSVRTRTAANLTVPTRTGFAPGKPPVICSHIPPPMRLGIWGQITGKPARWRAVGSPQAGCLLPSDRAGLGRTLAEKRRLIRLPMSGHRHGSAPARGRVCIAGEGRAHGQLPPLREDD